MCSPNGTNRVTYIQKLSSHAATTTATAAAHETEVHQAHLPSGRSLTSSLIPPGVDEKVLERQFISFILETATRDAPVSMPALGEFCIKHLGVSMKGYLHRFLHTRQHLFLLPDDGRQHVLLKQGAAEAVGGAAAEKLPNLPDDLLDDSSSSNITTSISSSYKDDDAVRIGGCRGGGGGGDGSGGAVNGASSSRTRNGGGVNGIVNGIVNGSSNSSNFHKFIAPLHRSSEYPRWDRLTQEMYDFILSKGGSAPFRDIDAYMKAKHGALIAASGVAASKWAAAKLSWKRRNIFRKEGPMCVLHTVSTTPASTSVHTRGGGGVRRYERTSSSRVNGSDGKIEYYVGKNEKDTERLEGEHHGREEVEKEEMFPPLLPCFVGSGNGDDDEYAVVGLPPLKSTTRSTTPAAAAAAVEDILLPPSRAVVSGSTPRETSTTSEMRSVLAAFAAERHAMEALRDEIYSNLSSLKAFSELRKENAELRAVCATLSRELRAVKDEIASIRTQLSS